MLRARLRSHDQQLAQLRDAVAAISVESETLSNEEREAARARLVDLLAYQANSKIEIERLGMLYESAVARVADLEAEIETLRIKVNSLQGEQRTGERAVMKLMVEVAPGELIDKITILEIKLREHQGRDQARQCPARVRDPDADLSCQYRGDGGFARVDRRTAGSEREDLGYRGRDPRPGAVPRISAINSSRSPAPSIAATIAARLPSARSTICSTAPSSKKRATPSIRRSLTVAREPHRSFDVRAHGIERGKDMWPGRFHGQ